MIRTFTMVPAIVTLGCSVASVGHGEDVLAATQPWIEAMNSRDPERVVRLYDPEAVLWGTTSPTLRDTPARIREYFKDLPSAPPEFKAVLGDQQIRVYSDIVINTGSYRFTSVRDGRRTETPARFSFVYRILGASP